jgi:hypothetical protein
MQVEALSTEDLSRLQGASDSRAIDTSGIDASAIATSPIDISPIDISDDTATSLADLGSGLAGEVFGGLPRRRRNIGQPKCLLDAALHNGDGVGPVAALEEYSGKLLVITLEITDVVERTGLTVSIRGSENQSEWGIQPLLKFRQRQYCGVYSVLLNMAAHPEVRYLRVEWSTSRWGKTERVPAFGFKVFVEKSGARVRSSATA